MCCKEVEECCKGVEVCRREIGARELQPLGAKMFGGSSVESQDERTPLIGSIPRRGQGREQAPR